jgi:hypothetical protein
MISDGAEGRMINYDQSHSCQAKIVISLLTPFQG